LPCGPPIHSPTNLWDSHFCLCVWLQNPRRSSSSYSQPKAAAGVVEVPVELMHPERTAPAALLDGLEQPSAVGARPHHDLDPAVHCKKRSNAAGPAPPWDTLRRAGDVASARLSPAQPTRWPPAPVAQRLAQRPRWPDCCEQPQPLQRRNAEGLTSRRARVASSRHRSSWPLFPRLCS